MDKMIYPIQSILNLPSQYIHTPNTRMFSNTAHLLTLVPQNFWQV